MIPSQPSHLPSSALVQSDASRAQRRCTLLFGFPVLKRGLNGLGERFWQFVDHRPDERGRGQLGLFFDGGEQLVECLGKQFHAVFGELVRDRLHGDSGATQIGHRLVRRVEILLQARARLAVIAKRVERRRGNGIDRIRTDQAPRHTSTSL